MLIARKEITTTYYCTYESKPLLISVPLLAFQSATKQLRTTCPSLSWKHLSTAFTQRRHHHYYYYLVL